MGEYTKYLADLESRISPEDEMYIEKMLEVAGSFRRFDESLDEFIAEKGFGGDLSDVEAKVAFIRGKLESEGISIAARTIRKWFTDHVRAKDRRIAFQLCFAFRLDFDETQNFFRKVYLQRGIDCHDMTEAIYYYCIRHQMSYKQAQELIRRAEPDGRKGSIDLSGDVLFTGSIIQELDRFRDPEEMLAFFEQNREQFGYNNATAYRYIHRLWERITGDGGAAQQEARLLYPHAKVPKGNRSVWDIYLQMFGLLDYDEQDNSRLFVLESDRTLQPIFKDNRLLHPIASASFPDRQGMEGIIRGENKSFEVVRKTMILLAFYRYWAELSVRSGTNYYHPEAGEAERCISSINRLLLDAGYPALYEGNPYDWIFMFAARDTYPLDAFRFFMREVYLMRSDNRN